MKKKKIKKGILLLSMVMVIISTVLPVTSSAADYIYERGDILWEFESPNSFIRISEEAKQYMLENVESLTQNNFYYIKVIYNNTEYNMNVYEEDENEAYNLFYNDEETHRLEIYGGSNLVLYFSYFNGDNLQAGEVKIIIYEIIERDVRSENLLSETTNGIGTVLTWVKSLWNGITTGQMKAILPIFAIFVIVPIILLVIKIIKKSTWGD